MTYDLTQDQAVVNVGVSHDTAEFASKASALVAADGHAELPGGPPLLVCADAGGSNGNRLRAWKMHLQRLATEMRFPITVCHYPPGTSKWNAIETALLVHQHELERPVLVGYEAVVNLISHTRA
jgi:Rhodopirellula transposase DDE domain